MRTVTLLSSRWWDGSEPITERRSAKAAYTPNLAARPKTGVARREGSIPRRLGAELRLGRARSPAMGSGLGPGSLGRGRGSERGPPL
jgi:hypothetical protein